MGEVDRFKRTPQSATINRGLACLRSILILAAKDGIIEKVPYVKLLEKNTRSGVATQQELKALLKVSPPHLQEILICLWDTGMRKAEALNLTWDRVDLRQARKISEGFDRDWVKMITGHRTNHVFRRYNRPSPEALRSVVAKDVNEVLTEPQGSDGEFSK